MSIENNNVFLIIKVNNGTINKKDGFFMKKIALILLMLLLTFTFGCTVSKGSVSFKLTGPSKVEVGKVIKLSVSTDEVVVWSTDNMNVANVVDGYVYGISEGKAIIKATLASDDTNVKSILITVTPSTGTSDEVITITGESTIELDKKATLTASSTKTLVWVSSNPLIATVLDGKVTAISKGSVIIRVYEEDNPLNFGSIEIVIVEKRLTLVGPTEVELHQEAVYDVTLDVNVIWSTSNPNIATIDQNGNLVAMEMGTVIVKAENIVNLENMGTYLVTITPPSGAVDDSFDYYKTKILSISQTQYKMELLDVLATNYTTDTTVLRLKNGETSVASFDDLYIGMENIYVEVGKDSNTISKILIDGDAGFNNIRVAIRKSIDDIANTATLYHDTVIFNTTGATVLKTHDNTFTLNLFANQTINILVNNQTITVRVDNVTVLETKKRIMFVQEEGVELRFMSIYRGRIPSYADTMEVSIHNGRLVVVNDINLDKYLTKVVPSEMPTSWHLEALKAQAVAARTYAYMDILNKSNDRYGYTVDDSVKSQVYNNANPVARSTQAVNETKGLIMTSNGKPISAYYYSTSSGLTASGHEVWIEDSVIEPIDYLIGQNLTNINGSPLTFNYQSEASMLSFFKTIRVDTPDLNASLHRWSVKFTYAQLTNTLNTNLKISYAAAPKSVLTKVNNSWVSKDIPSNIGAVQSINVSSRGTSGVVVSVDIITSTGEYRIINQYNIRFSIRPRDAGGSVYRYYAKNTDLDYSGPATNDSILLSGFFAIEPSNDGVTFYGGGNGHGVGMSQYGAYGLATQGKTYQEILLTYYSNINLSDITYSYTPILNYREYF